MYHVTAQCNGYISETKRNDIKVALQAELIRVET
uniref:Uncharacterized protein n=1 Tax=Arundo donax TaxID=35708 RepID=A0A0A9BJ80_ARUDO